MKTTNSKMLLLCAVVLLTPIFLQAQYNIFYGQQLDHTYLSIEEVNEDESHTGNGYIISTTTYDAPSTTPITGEITRTTATGTLQWVNQYVTTSGPRDHRFNSIKKFLWNGRVEYLVVGSLIDGGTTTLLAAIIDDNGAVLASKELRSTGHDHLLGIKGIAVSDESFAIVALEANGFNNSDAKNIVVIKLDQNLNLQNSMTVSSPSTTNDYDMATDIIEGASVDEFFIIGTSNKNGSSSQPCAFAALVEVPANSVVWSHNYSTALGYHWDAAADGYYVDNKLYVLANSSIIHYYNLIELDANSGAINNEIQYSDVTYGGDFNHYGYEIKKSLNEDDKLVISGWKSLYSTDAVQPFLVEVNPSDASISWHWKYDGYNNNQLSLNENNWLYLKAGGQFPYYYNDMMTYRPDRKGYAMLSSFDEGKESIFLWYATDLNGNVSEDCGYDTVDADSIVIPFYYNAPVAPVTDHVDEGADNFLRESPINYEESPCDWEFNKNGTINAIPENVENIFTVYPNPATNTLYISGNNVAKVEITDILGRTVVTQNANAQTLISINVNGIKTGIYFVNITTTNGEMNTQKVEIIK